MNTSTTGSAPLTHSPPRGPFDGPAGRPLVEVVVPVHNEERVLVASVRRLHGYLAQTFPYRFRITVADNASTDRTWPLARALAERLPHVAAVRLEEKGRGRALRHVWSRSDADVVAYMDVDLSTDLDAFLPLVAPLISGHSQVAIGSRLTRGAAVVRGPRREVISRCYNLLLRTTLAARFSDAQCGFKAVRAEVAQALLPRVRDEAWFFDTELLLLAERSGLRIHEVPVDWVDDPDSRVQVWRTAMADLRGMARVAHQMRSLPQGSEPAEGAALPEGMGRQLARFAAVGVASTAFQLALFVLLRTVLGPLAANALSLVIATVGNTAANRRFTFGVRGRRGVVRHHFEGGAVFLLGLGLSTAGLALVHALMPGASRGVELAALVTANGTATLVRFLAMRAWVFHPRRLRPQLDDLS